MKSIQDKLVKVFDPLDPRRATAGDKLHINIPKDVNAKPLLITGKPGGGKATSIAHLFQKMREAGIPFVVLEASKIEVMALATRDRQPCFKNTQASCMSPSDKSRNGGSNV